MRRFSLLIVVATIVIAACETPSPVEPSRVAPSDISVQVQTTVRSLPIRRVKPP
jgi:predicted component of type VI protein secretion system